MADTNTQIEVLNDFMDNFSKLSKDNQLVLLGMLKGMVVVNDINSLQSKGA